MTNEQTELLECLDQLAKHIRAGETLNPNNAASIVEDAAAALRAHEPKAPQCGATVGETSGFSAAECALPAGHPGVHQWQPLNRGGDRGQ